jgi:hypothetical protein
MRVDLLVNPFCMAERDVESIRGICERLGAVLNVYNLWDIDDDALGEVPAYAAELILELRSGGRPGSVYSNVFVDGERLPLNAWPEHLKTVEEKIVASKGKAE